MSPRAEDGQTGSEANSQATTPATSTTASSAPSADDNLTCRWNSCNSKFPSPEALYVSFHPALPLNPVRPADWANQGPHLRPPCRPQEHKQPQLDLSVEQLQDHHCQAGSHHVPHPRARPAEAAQVRLLRQVVQASPGPEEARQGECLHVPSGLRMRILTASQTHADDSVLGRSPQDDALNGYRGQHKGTSLERGFGFALVPMR